MSKVRQPCLLTGVGGGAFFPGVGAFGPHPSMVRAKSFQIRGINLVLSLFFPRRVNLSFFYKLDLVTVFNKISVQCVVLCLSKIRGPYTRGLILPLI